MDDHSKVREFHGKFGLAEPGLPTFSERDARLRLAHIEEELSELRFAIEQQDLAATADALMDIAYLVHGTAINLGLPWAELFADVHRANMQKKRVDLPNHKFGITKPPGWEGPRTAAILARHGHQEPR